MQIRVEVPLNLTLFPPQFVRLAARQMSSEQVRNNFPNTTAKMVKLGELAVDRWAHKIDMIPGRTGRPLQLGPYVGLNKTEYGKSLRLTPAAWEPNALTVTVYSDDPQSILIEEGTPGGEMDLHRVLPNAKQARLSKPRKTQEGVLRQYLYLRVPFRHVTQSAEGGPVLPKSVIAVMQNKPKYLVTERYVEPSVTRPGELAQRFRYAPHLGRLTEKDLAELNRRAGARRGYLIPPGGAAAPPVLTRLGLQRMVGLMRTGDNGHGGYLIIRTLSEANPEGWRIPGYPAQHLLQQVRQDVEREILQGFFDEAIRADMQVWLANAGA